MTSLDYGNLERKCRFLSSKVRGLEGRRQGEETDLTSVIDLMIIMSVLFLMLVSTANHLQPLWVELAETDDAAGISSDVHDHLEISLLADGSIVFRSQVIDAGELESILATDADIYTDQPVSLLCDRQASWASVANLVTILQQFDITPELMTKNETRSGH